jgi:hypothetical protein
MKKWIKAKQTQAEEQKDQRITVGLIATYAAKHPQIAV